MKKALIVLLISSFMLCGCGMKYNNYYNSDEIIVDQSDHYNYKNCVGEIQEKKVDLKFEFSGTDTIWTIESEKDKDIECLYNAKIKNGKFKTVFISPDKTIGSELEGNTDAIIMLQLKAGTNIIKIVGVDCKGELSMSVDDDLSGIKIEANDKKEFPLK
jgi:hypothetical protein